MRPLRDWSLATVAGICVAWLGIVALAGALIVRRALANMEADARATLPPGAALLPAQLDDFFVVVGGGELLLAALFVVGPPLLLTLAWRSRRRRAAATS